MCIKTIHVYGAGAQGSPAHIIEGSLYIYVYRDIYVYGAGAQR